MALQRLHDWIQLATGIAVLIGLGLVVWELRQAREFAELDLIQRDFAQLIDNSRAAMGESPMTVVAKACDGVEPLSEEEYLILDAYFSTLYTQAATGGVVYTRMGADVPGWRAIAATSFNRLFRTEQGRNWFANRAVLSRATGNEHVIRIVSIGEDQLRNFPETGCHTIENEFSLRASGPQGR